MFRASSAYLQEDTVVYLQHMVLSLCMRVPGGLSVHSLSEKGKVRPSRLCRHRNKPHELPATFVCPESRADYRL